MSYTVNKTNGAVLATVADGTIDTTTDLTLIGKNYAGYGEVLNENFVRLLENFANTAAPSAPIAGQLYWDTSGSIMQVYTGTAWKTISSSTAAASQPSNSVTGDLWWDTTNSQLKVYDGSDYILIGPAFTAGTGQSGPTVTTVVDSGATSHVVVQMYVGGTIVAIISKDTVFTPQSAITGFATISPGYNLSTTVTGAKYVGESTDATTLSTLTASQFLRADTTDSTSGQLSVLNDSGFIIGADSDITISVSGSDVTFTQATLDGDLIFSVNDGGSPTTAFTIDGATSRAIVAGDPTVANGVANKNYVDNQIGAITADAITNAGDTLTIDGTANTILPGVDNVLTLGSGSFKFLSVDATTFNGVSTSAQYADVAENFTSDAKYSAGTLVALGGAEEITRVNEDLDDNVFGVISTAPAHLMNAGLTDGIPVALTGRCPVQIEGSVSKGDRLVSAGNGKARAALLGEATHFNTIGRALKNSEGGFVEAFVTVN